ncbi:uncharacterized protein TM35_000961020 [Trypanosoma theileri]|uniref:Mucin TcMUCII n=1 Tax=Trypanosoma theileri TaxID=67003 RepID=A0A1X0NG72_9TRYP|nr:uncharacterized protein TM35_000961020 [Trypanosoma theileri]ORC82223.1 hypothetical protein TM35_000961020 [Trypanosoma theileri]
MVRCYLLCLLTFTLCCTCGVVLANDPAVSLAPEGGVHPTGSGERQETEEAALVDSGRGKGHELVQSAGDVHHEEKEKGDEEEEVPAAYPLPGVPPGDQPPLPAAPHPQPAASAELTNGSLSASAKVTIPAVRQNDQSRTDIEVRDLASTGATGPLKAGITQEEIKKLERTPALQSISTPEENSEVLQTSHPQTEETLPKATQENHEKNADNQSVSSGSTTTNDGAPTESSSSTTTEANATPSPQETVGNNESDNITAASGTASEGSGSTNNPTNADTTTTTTTTTTLPPQLTNNKKGDADSSSSISSSVWVRVPLLIVATLACILVC